MVSWVTRRPDMFVKIYTNFVFISTIVLSHSVSFGQYFKSTISLKHFNSLSLSTNFGPYWSKIANWTKIVDLVVKVKHHFTLKMNGWNNHQNLNPKLVLRINKTWVYLNSETWNENALFSQKREWKRNKCPFCYFTLRSS